MKFPRNLIPTSLLLLVLFSTSARGNSFRDWMAAEDPAAFQASRAASVELNSFRQGQTKNQSPLTHRPLVHAGLAKTVTIVNGADVKTLLASAATGDSVVFNNVVYRGVLTFAGGINYSGQLKTIVGKNEFGVHVKSGAQNFSINLLGRSNCGMIVADGPISDFSIDGDYQWGDHNALGADGVGAVDGTYYNRIAFRATSGIARCTISGNYHDSLNSDRTFDIYNNSYDTWSVTQLNVNDGGHIDGTHNHTHIAKWNVKNVHRMGLELQDQGSSGGDDILIENYVCDTHVNPYNESFGISLMPQRHTNVRLMKPYCRAGTNAITMSGVTHKGYGIENGMSTGSIIDGAIVIGDYVAAFACAMKVPLTNCIVFGSQQWGGFSTEPGLNGNGTYVDGGGNKSDQPMANAPNPAIGSTSAPALTISNVQAIAGLDTAGNDIVTISWTAANAKAGDVVNIVRTIKGGDGKFSVRDGDIVAVPATDGTFTDNRFSATQISQHWEFLYAVGGVSAMKSAQIGVTIVPPPATQPADDPIVEVKPIGVFIPSGGYQVKRKSGKVELVK